MKASSGVNTSHMVTLEMTDDEARYIVAALRHCAEEAQGKSEYINGPDFEYSEELQELADIINDEL